MVGSSFLKTWLITVFETGRYSGKEDGFGAVRSRIKSTLIHERSLEDIGLTPFLDNNTYCAVCASISVHLRTSGSMIEHN